MAEWPFCCTVGPTTSTVCRRRATPGRGGLARDCSVSARLRDNALPFGRDAPQWPAGGPPPPLIRFINAPHNRKAVPDGFDQGGRSSRLGGAPWADRFTVPGPGAGLLYGPRVGRRGPVPPKGRIPIGAQYHF